MDKTYSENRIESRTLWWVAGIIALVAVIGLLVSNAADNTVDGRAAVPITETTVSPGTPAVPNTGSE